MQKNTTTDSAEAPTHKKAAESKLHQVPLVSIVTPSYNQGRFLKETIESVLQQTYPHIEYLVMDGGSTDNSVDILKSYGDKFYWVSEKDGGQTAAINKGLLLCKGDILAYLNSDDIIHPQAVEMIVEQFLQNPNLDMVYGDADYIDANGAIIGCYASSPYSFSRLMADCIICQPATFWTRRITDKIGLFDETITCSMDYDYWLRIATAGGKVKYYPKTIACSRLYAETKTKSNRHIIYQENFKICKKHGGYIHLSHCQGYIDYLVKEQQHPLWRRLAPTDHKICQWSRRFCTIKNVGLFAAIPTYFKFRLFLLHDHPEIADKWLNKWFIWRLSRNFLRLCGVYADGWLADRVRYFQQSTYDELQEIWFSGVAVRDMDVRIYLNGKLSHQQKLFKDQSVKITLALQNNRKKDLLIQFSDYTVDRVWRRLSFKLHGSNLFKPDSYYKAFTAAFPYLS